MRYEDAKRECEYGGLIYRTSEPHVKYLKDINGGLDENVPPIYMGASDWEVYKHWDAYASVHLPISRGECPDGTTVEDWIQVPSRNELERDWKISTVGYGISDIRGDIHESFYEKLLHIMAKAKGYRLTKVRNVPLPPLIIEE